MMILFCISLVSHFQNVFVSFLAAELCCCDLLPACWGSYSGTFSGIGLGVGSECVFGSLSGSR